MGKASKVIVHTVPPLGMGHDALNVRYPIGNTHSLPEKKEKMSFFGLAQAFSLN